MSLVPCPKLNAWRHPRRESPLETSVGGSECDVGSCPRPGPPEKRPADGHGGRGSSLLAARRCGRSGNYELTIANTTDDGTGGIDSRSGGTERNMLVPREAFHCPAGAADGCLHNMRPRGRCAWASGRRHLRGQVSPRDKLTSHKPPATWHRHRARNPEPAATNIFSLLLRPRSPDPEVRTTCGSKLLKAWY